MKSVIRFFLCVHLTSCIYSIKAGVVSKNVLCHQRYFRSSDCDKRSWKGPSSSPNNSTSNASNWPKVKQLSDSIRNLLEHEDVSFSRGRSRHRSLRGKRGPSKGNSVPSGSRSCGANEAEFWSQLHLSSHGKNPCLSPCETHESQLVAVLITGPLRFESIAGVELVFEHTEGKVVDHLFSKNI